MVRRVLLLANLCMGVMSPEAERLRLQSSARRVGRGGIVA